RFDAGRRLQLEARDDRPWMNRDDLGLDAEIGELDLAEARHLLEIVGRRPALAMRRIVEPRQRRQLAGRDRLEQRDLPLPLDADAALDLLDRRLDPRRLGLRLAARLRDQLLPLLLRAAALEEQPHAADERPHLGDAR